MRTDILYTDDLQITNGDFEIGESDQQHIRHILEAMQGSYKQKPLLGVGIREYLNSPMDGELRRLIQLQLQADGYSAVNITSDGQNVNIYL